jgi:hypothetical protein
MAKYNIKDAEGNVLNTIVADVSFVEENFEFYEEFEEPVVAVDETVIAENEAKEWRDSELERTDLLMVVPDYPYKTQLEAYRQALRDWPSSENFPETRPTLEV